MNIKIGLLSNCFSEETEYIKQKCAFILFLNAPYMSYEQVFAKPNEEFFKRCINTLNIKADECLYVGDGGSQELEVARKLGMYPLQAVWYLNAGNFQHCGRKNEFLQIENPMDVIKYLK